LKSRDELVINVKAMALKFKNNNNNNNKKQECYSVFRKMHYSRMLVLKLNVIY